MLTDWALRLRSLIKHNAVEMELDDELRFHFEHLVESYVRQGMARDQAMRMARIEFGGLDLIKEEHRDVRGIRLLDDVGRDVRYAVRQLRHSPGFAFVAILCLGLGIGVNTAMFGVLNSVLLRPMPVVDPDRLTIINRSQNGSFSYADYRDFQDRSRVLSGLAASLPMESDLDVDGESEFVAAEVVTPSYAAVLGVRPLLGRWFVDEREPVAVISYAIWERRFNLSPDVIGRRIQSESQAYTIAGVAPRTFAGVFAPIRTDIWVPIRTRPSLAAILEKGSRMMMLFGRLNAGATVAQAAAELNAIDTQLAAEHGKRLEIRMPVLVEQAHGLPNRENRRMAQTIATLLTAVVAVVLLIACVNIGNLLLARGAMRHHEFAMRRALGATKLRLLRQLLTESVVLAVGGGICGVVLAVWTSRLLERSLRSLPSVFPSQLDLSLDWRVIAFATAISLATIGLCGFLPAWRASQATGLVTVKGWTRGGTRRWRPLGLIAQVVMSLVLLFVAGSFLEALTRLQATEPGFATVNRLYAYVYVPTPPFTPDTGRAFYARAVERLRVLPGIRRAALTDSLPLMPSGTNCASLPSGPQIPITNAAVDIGYFGTMSIDLIAGHDFTVDDLSEVAPSVVITESLASRLWPERPALGERVMIGCDKTQASVVTGIVRDSAIRSVGEPGQPHAYHPFERQYAGRLTAILIETTASPSSMVRAVREALVSLGQGIRVYKVQPLREYVEQSYAETRWQSAVVSCFGLLALLLAAIGLYGVIAYRVSLRTQEIGIRMALGAGRAAIFRQVVWQSFAIVFVGVAVGEVLTVSVTRLVGSLQPGIQPAGFSTHVIIGVIWIVLAFVACYVPAVHAARVDPLVALRCE